MTTSFEARRAALSPAIHAVGAGEPPQHVEALAAILRACVRDSASVGFILPFEIADARRFWTDSVAPAVASGKRILLVARIGGDVVGTGQLNLDTMPNQVHRADVMKVLVHPDHQRKGIGRGLMLELERIATGLGRTLLTLDTVTGDKAEPLYLSLGYERGPHPELRARSAA